MHRVLKLTVAVFVAVTAVGAGCSRIGSSSSSAEAVIAANTTSDAFASLSSAQSHFASAPDKGYLIAYQGSAVRHDGTAWYRADISEAHALRSTLTGSMVVSTPGGAPIRLRYERHTEHSNGNWTWIGRNAQGEDAVVTFGEKAVFGSIRTGTRELRLTTSGGRSWLVDVDLAEERQPEPKEPDYLVPPELAASLALSGPRTASAAQEALAATSTTVDVALGYTTGYASELGGDSQAVTRLQHLVDVTNQAYANSQIEARIRLVKAVSVNYADATSNDTALSQLTGYQAGSGPIAVDPAFNGLRAARDQYGADLVSLVRRFRTPENQGCGVAWLIGGNQSNIDTSDAPFGYSVVSDDIDKGDINESDGLKYVCRKESLAHELGHNMGQNHNTEDSGGDSGAHAYSYGYREALSSGFYTVMAYRLASSTQFGVRYFANPNVMEATTGRPTGVANSSDNARSLAQTMPIITGFRATVVPIGRVRSDIDGDGKADLFWRNQALQRADWWYMNGAAHAFGGSKTVAAQYRVAGRGDFDGDGRSDVLWEDGTTIWLWRTEALGGFTVHFVANHPGAGWAVAGVGDINGDGRTDLFWSNRTLQRADWWTMNGANWSFAGTKSVPAQYRVAGVDDFDGDGRSDVLWEDGATIWLWRSQAAGGFSVSLVTNFPGSGWAIAGTGDFNADGRADIFWSNRNLQRADWWHMNGSAWSFGGTKSVPTQYHVAQTGDFDGDGRGDVIWEDGSTIWLWRAQSGGGFSVNFVANHPANGWAIAP